MTTAKDSGKFFGRSLCNANSFFKFEDLKNKTVKDLQK